METRAVAKYVRISPQKVRLVVDMIRGKKVEDADRILTFTPKKAAGIVKKILKSAVANATQNPNIDENILYVKETYVGQGPTMRRWRARAQGRVAPIRKKMSHITIILGEQ